jgi:KUP system potassium uptake protein
MLLGLFGAALFYGDGVITPAISVLSAVEGLEVATPAFKPYVLPISLIILVGLFAVQRHGTAAVGTFFGPIMVLWFLTLGILGFISIAHDPAVLRALGPWHAVRFFGTTRFSASFALGAAVLALTGAEALYADMGHFGRKPIQLPGLAWFCRHWSQLFRPGRAACCAIRKPSPARSTSWRPTGCSIRWSCCPRWRR